MKTLLISATISCIITFAANAQVILTFDGNVTDGLATTSLDPAQFTISANSLIDDNSSTSPTLSGTTSFTSRGDGTLRFDGSFDTDGNAATVITGAGSDRFFEFTIQPDAGFQIDLTSISFDAAEAQGGANGFAFFDAADVTGTTTIGDAFINVYNEGTTLTTYNHTFDSSYDAITAATPVTLRYYITGSNASRAMLFDNFQVSGVISPIPEPSTFSLLGLGALAFCLYRKRK